MSDVDECEEMETGNKSLYCKTDFGVKKLELQGKSCSLPTKIPGQLLDNL